MQPNPSPDNNQRPAEFDARVISYAPMLRRLAARLTAAQDKEDLVQETIATAMRRWCGFREDGGFYKWLRLVMIGIVENDRRLARRKYQHLSVEVDDGYSITSGDYNQDDVLQYKDTMKAVLSCRHSEYLLALIDGIPQSEIVREQNIRQSTASTRAGAAKRELITKLAA